MIFSDVDEVELEGAEEKGGGVGKEFEKGKLACFSSISPVSFSAQQ